jgi:hypothetical protein
LIRICIRTAQLRSLPDPHHLGTLVPMLLGDALRIMDKVDKRGAPIPFSISWCTLDRKRMTGGEVRRLDRAIRCSPAQT